MATKQFNRTVEAINELLDKLDGLPTFPLVYRGEVLEYTDLPEEPVQGDCYLVSFETGTDHVSNKLYYYSGTVWKEIAVDGYTKYEIDQMFDSIGGGLHWKGAVSYYSNLPSDAELGDMWTVLYEGTSGSEACGDEYAWGTLNGTEQWILIGKETYSKTQIDAMVDGLTDRIAIDENNILLSYNLDGQHNLLPLQNGVYSASTSTITVQDGVATLKSVDTGTHLVQVGTFMLKAGTYVLFNRYTSTGNGDIRLIKGSTSITTGNPATFTLNEDANIAIQFYTYNAIAESTIQPMLVTEAQYNSGLRDFQPYALPNTTITPALKECVDNGVKNLVAISDSTITGSNYVFDNVPCNIPAGSYVFSYTSNQSIQGDVEFVIKNSGGTTITSKTVTSSSGRVSIPFTISETGSKLTLYSVRAGTYSKFMICEKSLDDVSSTFVPYALSNAELTAEKVDRGEQFASNTAKTYTVINDKTYMLTVISYGNSGVFLLHKYASETDTRIYTVYKSTNFDSAITIAATANSNNVVVTPNNTWFFSTISCL